MQSMLDEFKARGWDVSPEFEGADQRFKTADSKGKKPIWFRGYKIQIGDKVILKADWYDHRDKAGTKGSWSSDAGATYTPEELAKIAEATQKHKEVESAKQKKLQEAAAVMARKIWDTSSTITGQGDSNHPYLIKKKVYPGQRCKMDYDGNLCIPIYNTDKQIVSIQTIFREPSEAGDKRLFKNGQKKGCFSWYVPETAPPNWWLVDTLYIAEGFSTAASIGMALDVPVLIAIDANNMVEVCKELPIKPKKVVICADNDQWGKENAGLLAAEKSAAILRGQGIEVEIRYPKFTKVGPNSIYDIEKPTDWNDYMVICGKAELRNTLLGNHQIHQEDTSNTPPDDWIQSMDDAANEIKTPAVPPESDKADVLTQHEPSNTITQQSDSVTGCQAVLWSPPVFNSIEKLCPEKDKDGKSISPSHQKIADHLYSILGKNLMREGKDVFIWNGTHWKEQDPFNFRSYIRRCAQHLKHGRAEDKHLNAIYNLFIDTLDQVPGDSSFYIQMPTICNFLDGTLELLKSLDGTYSLTFREHRKSDLCTWVLPYRYTDPRPSNELFSQWLIDSFHGDEDANGKIRALKQIGGACLITAFPRMVFLYGQAQTGKSTFAKLCMAFVGKGNYSSVEPENMKEFNLEGMINKRINVVTDISGYSIDKGLIKRFEDGLPFQVNRKGRQVVQVRIPSLHIYCANDLPSGIDGKSNAMDRRVTVLEFKNVIKSDGMKRDYEQDILAGGSGAVLQFFLEGLEDLCNSGGFYSNPDSSKEVMRQWKTENDPIQQFLNAIKAGEIEHGLLGKIVFKNDGKIKQKDLADAYFKFGTQSGVRHHMTRHKFYKEMRQKGYLTKTEHGYDFFGGFSVESLAPDSSLAPNF